jgi:beta-aspartyl-peptidase (threonine type)
MEYQRKTLEQAANRVIFEKLLPVGGNGGIIAVDKDGNYSMTFNTSGMFRGVSTAGGMRETAIFRD